MDNITAVFDNAKVEAGKFDPDDLMCFGKHYFVCGYHPTEMYYNHTFAVAIAIIGKLYGEKYGRMSNYHKGIAYIADELSVSRRCIKAIRKKMHGQGGYVFKTPYVIPLIVKKMIALLQAYEQNEIVEALLKGQDSKMYREILIGKQYSAINAAASKGKRARVLEVAGALGAITQKVQG